MKRINIGDIDVNAEVRGDGQPLLLVHGFPLDHTMWQHQIDAFADSCQVIAPDLRGFGQSDMTTDAVSMEQFADDLSNLLKAMGIDRPVTFCGLSMGGYIAWQFIARHAQQLNGLVLCDTRAAADSEEMKQSRAEAAEAVLRDGPQKLTDAMIPKLFCEKTVESNPEIVAETRAVMMQTSPTTIAAALAGMAQRHDATESLGQINIPTTVICGQFDIITPPSEMRSVADAIPNAEYFEITNAGHMAPLENPAEVNIAIRSLLDRVISA